MVSFRFVYRARFPHSFSFYGGLCRKVLADRLLFSSFLIAATLHGLGHGAMALAAGLLGGVLAAEPRLISSPLRFLSNPATLALVGVVATTLKGAGATVGATLQSRLAQNVAGSVRQGLAARLLASGTPMPPAQLSARLAVGFREVETGVEEGCLAALRASLTLVPLTIGLYVVSSTLAWAALLALVPFGVATSFARRAWKRSHIAALTIAEGLHREVDELVAHMDVWRTYGAGDRIRRTLSDLGDQAARAASHAQGSRAALSSANEVLAAMALLSCIWLTRALSLSLGDGTLIAFAAVFFMSYRPLRDLGDARTALERGAYALRSLEDLVPSQGEPVASGEASGPRAWGREILVVERVGVRRHSPSGGRLYAPALTSFTVRPGEIVTIAGPTGSGKTTLLRALLGLEAEGVGSVRYGSRDLTVAGVGPGDRPFAWMPQESPIIAGSLEDNLLCDGQDSRAAFDLLALLGAGRFVRECEGVQLGASGRPVSGGERKWIALGRAMATGMPVLLLDEPTAGLDRQAQVRVLAALERMRGERTVILVSHQPEAMAIADRVVQVGTAEYASQHQDASEHEYEDVSQ